MHRSKLYEPLLISGVITAFVAAIYLSAQKASIGAIACTLVLPSLGLLLTHLHGRLNPSRFHISVILLCCAIPPSVASIYASGILYNNNVTSIPGLPLGGKVKLNDIDSLFELIDETICDYTFANKEKPRTTIKVFTNESCLIFKVIISVDTDNLDQEQRIATHDEIEEHILSANKVDSPNFFYAGLMHDGENAITKSIVGTHISYTNFKLEKEFQKYLTNKPAQKMKSKLNKLIPL